jgi:hypothetical protein
MYVLLTPRVNEGKWSASRPGKFIYGEIAPDIRWMWNWIGFTVVERKHPLSQPGYKHQILGHPAHRQSLYRLRNTDSIILTSYKILL